MSRRHYKQKYDPNAEFVWLCRRRWANGMTNVGDDFVETKPGQSRKLWRLGWIGLKDWGTDAKAAPPKREPPKPPNLSTGPVVQSTAGGRHKVTYKGETYKVRGKAALDQLLEELEGKT